MPPKSRADLKKAEAERLQALVVDLLREDENKYCADCEAKQPRWASWNLGVFLCIRCAGIHRNLGVHLTKIKSVNLDSWTAEQVQSMRVMGNAKAKAVYEAELPDHFRRPQTDQALESFIRAKYEHKRYMLKDWSPPRVDINDLPPPPEKHRHNDRVIKTGSSKVTIPLGTTEKLSSIPSPCATQSMTPQPVNSNVEPPLLDLASPSQPPTISSNKQCSDELKNSALCWDEDAVDMTSSNGLNVETLNAPAAADPLEDMFGPIVSAAPINSSLNLNTDCASTSERNETTKQNTSANNLGDLASISLTSTSESEKKSKSDILALFDCAPKLPIRTANPLQQHQQQQQMPAQFTQMNTSNEMNGMFGAFGTSQSAQMQMPRQVGGFYAPNIIPHSQPAYGQFTNQMNNAMPAIGTFMSRETAAAFAAASPFANPSMLNSCASTNPNTTSSTIPSSTNANITASFDAFADLQSLQMNSLSTCDTSISGGTITSGSATLNPQRLPPSNLYKNNPAAGEQLSLSTLPQDSVPKIGTFVADFSRLGLGHGDAQMGAVEENPSQANASIWD
ncbi:unnamed protein product [Anisakis simplex]|uniref:Putative smap1 (inferred by orthology to a S. mansoni protein) n=1 Tax=Anisakis simplex TaxID=6269 RepID=A0A0M3JXP3_ANISI|nr:unnamed protein product [Anisakis simplex]